MARTKQSSRKSTKSPRKSKSRKSSKRGSSVDGEKKKKRSHRDQVNFKQYVKRISSEVGGATKFSSEAKNETNQVGLSLANRLIDQALRFFKTTKRKTLTDADVTAAVRLVLKGLANDALAYGEQAVAKFNAYKSKKDKRVSKNVRAGLIIPISRVKRLIKQKMGGGRLRTQASIYLAAAVEYVLQVLLKAASEYRKKDTQRLGKRNLLLAVREDPDLDKLFKNTVLSGGVAPSGMAKRGAGKEESE